MKRFSILLIALACALSSFKPKTEEKVFVAVAANMQFAIEPLKAEFERETAIRVETSIGSSGALCTQIMQSEPYDVFVSADMSFPEELHKKGFATAAPEVYAHGVLVLWTDEATIKLTPDMSSLLGGNVKHIAIANPKTAPYGTAAEEALKYFKVYDRLKDKLVYGENLAQTQQFILSEAADIGFIAKSQAIADDSKHVGHWIEVDKKAYAPIAQGAVILKHGQQSNNGPAQRFYHFLYSPQAKAILKKYGYIVN